VYHLAHQNIVIAHGHDPVDGALDGRQHARQQGHSGHARLPRHTVEATRALARKALGQGSLVFR
jgi:hypothetical protein